MKEEWNKTNADYSGRAAFFSFEKKLFYFLNSIRIVPFFFISRNRQKIVLKI